MYIYAQVCRTATGRVCVCEMCGWLQVAVGQHVFFVWDVGQVARCSAWQRTMDVAKVGMSGPPYCYCCQAGRGDGTVQLMR